MSPGVDSPGGGARDVERLLRPRSIAVVGPSARNPAAVRNLITAADPVWGVHPTQTQVLGLPCVPEIADLPAVPDLAVLLVGHTRVEAAFEAAAAAGVRAFVIPGVGSEAGAEGPVVAGRLRARAEALGAAVLGHNCMGMAQPGGSAWIGTIPEDFVPGDVAVLAQSGSVAEAMITLGPRVGFRRVVSLGGELTRDVADFLTWQAAEAGTRAIGLFLETVRRPEPFMAALETCAGRGIPVACLKVGRSALAQRVALAHTGALVGSAAAFSAMLRRFEVIEVDDFPQLVETLEVLGRRRRPAGVRAAAVSESGGECELLADRAQVRGLDLTRLPEATEASLREAFPNLTRAHNPIDAWGIDEPDRVFPLALDLLARSGAYDTVIAQVDLSRFRGEDEALWCELAVRAVAAAGSAHDVFAAVVSVTSTDPPTHLARLARELDLPLLRGIDHAAFALAAAGRWRPARPRPAPTGPRMDLGGLLAASPSDALPEFESAQVLQRYGIPVAPRERAATPREAGAAASRLGFPVVVKRDGPAHKSAGGGVLLGLTDEAAVVSAARRLGGPVLVARQLEAGAEAFCGMTRDPQLGPVVAVGRGGAGVESLRPVAVVAPLDEQLALQLVAEAGLAGVSPTAATVLARSLVALGRIGLEQPGIVAVDINPLIMTVDGATAVDALVVRSSLGRERQ